MTTARETTDRAERTKQSISRNGSSTRINVEVIMNEWQDAIGKIREALCALRKPWDKRRPAEDELGNILFVIETAFSFGWGDTPMELECHLCERGDKFHMETCEKMMLWNYPEFAKTISARAKNLNTTTQKLITRALEPLKDGRGNARQRALEQLFGKEYCISKLRELIDAPEDQKTRIKANKRVKQRELEETNKFVQVAGRKNI